MKLSTELTTVIPSAVDGYRDHPALRYDEWGQPCCRVIPQVEKHIEKEVIDGKEQDVTVYTERIDDGCWVRCKHHSALVQALDAKLDPLDKEYKKFCEKITNKVKAIADQTQDKLLIDYLHDRESEHDLSGMVTDIIPDQDLYALRQWSSQAVEALEQAQKLVDEIPF